MSAVAAQCPQLVSLRSFGQRCQGRMVLTAAGTGASSCPDAVGGGGEPAASAAGRVCSLFARGPMLSLERSVGDKYGTDQQLWDSCRFRAQVYPDLPLASSWRDLLRLTARGASHKAGEEREPPGAHSCPSQGWTVRTVAAQLRSRDQLRSMVLSAAGRDAAGEPRPGAQPADALLFVSGSHPARRLPGAGRWLQDSFDLLLMASTMREQGYLPPELSLWAVENPMLAPTARLQQKVDAGAEVVVTQPPLLWERAQRWAEDADKRLVTRNAKLVVGLPIIPSVGNLDFWLRLCNVRGLPEAEHLLASFPQGGGTASHEAAVRAWNADFISKVLGLPGVAGLHVMPLTKSARRMALEFLADGTLPSHTL